MLLVVACSPPCPAQSSPVCGEDLRTYAHPCHAGCQGVRILARRACLPIDFSDDVDGRQQGMLPFAGGAGWSPCWLCLLVAVLHGSSFCVTKRWSLANAPGAWYVVVGEPGAVPVSLSLVEAVCHTISQQFSDGCQELPAGIGSQLTLHFCSVVLACHYLSHCKLLTEKHDRLCATASIAMCAASLKCALLLLCVRPGDKLSTIGCY